jgi:predicted RNA-binding protein with PIN domain
MKEKLKRFVIDGHNLIPKIHGVHLRDVDDEQRLIEILSEYCRHARCQVEVFFDGAPPANKPTQKFGLVHAHFVRLGNSADDSILAFLRSNPSAKSQYTVVSSDHRVMNGAKSLGCETMSSDAFSVEITRVLAQPAVIQEMREKKLSEGEVAEWMKAFGENRQETKNS